MSNPPVYSTHIRLGADDSITLFWRINIVDMLDWEDGDAPAGYSYGCFPDGTKEVQTLISTKGYANEAVDL